MREEMGESKRDKKVRVAQNVREKKEVGEGRGGEGGNTGVGRRAKTV